MKKWTISLALFFFIVPCIAIAAPISYVMVTDDINFNGSDQTDVTAVFRITIDDSIRVYNPESPASYGSENPVIEVQPGETIPLDSSYYFMVTDWSVTFNGDSLALQDICGDGGGFRWFIGDYGGQSEVDWLNEWAFLYGEDSGGQFPSFYWSWNYQDPNSDNYMRLPSSFLVAGSVGDIGISGTFNPVPEPASIFLFLTGAFVLPAVSRKVSSFLA